MVNIVTSKFWRLGCLRIAFDIPSFPRCHREHTTVSQSFLFRPFGFFKCTINNRPNGVITMVSSLATKVHRTLHGIETDETMVRFLFPLMNFTSSNYVTTYRSLSFQWKLTDNHASKSILWVNEIGVWWNGRYRRGILFLILGLRKRKATVKPSGRFLTPWCSVSINLYFEFIRYPLVVPRPGW